MHWLVRGPVFWLAWCLTACTSLGPDAPSYPDDETMDGDLSTLAWGDELGADDETVGGDEGSGPPPRCADGVVPEQAIARPKDARARGGELRVERDGATVLLPLRNTRFDSHVTGTIVKTDVEQVFANPYDEPIEAIYVFPLPHDAAIHAYSMTIADRTIEGRIERRQRARELYEQARDEGRATALLDQERPNVFTQHVANIPPGEAIAVTLTMTGPISHRGAVSALVLPTVVGPRFIPGTPNGRSGTGRSPDTDRVPDGSRITPPMLPPGVVPCASLSVRVRIDAGIPIKGLVSRTHAIDRSMNRGQHVVQLASAGERLDHDFVLSWQADVPRPRASMTVHADGDDRYFALTVFPPEPQAAPVPVPRELVFVVDTSGSMSGKPLTVAKVVMKRLLGSLRADDAFRIVRFSTDAGVMSSAPLPATLSNREAAIRYLADLEADGGTDMQRWIETVFADPPARGRVRHVVLLSDGYVGDEAWIFSEVHRVRGAARIFGLGVGSSVNRHLIDGLARAGGGSAFYLGIDERPVPVIRRFYDALAHPVLTDLSIDWGSVEVEDVVFGSARDLFVGRPVVVYGRLLSDKAGRVRIRGRSGDGPVEIGFDVDPLGAASHESIEAMWARAQVAEQQARLLAKPEAAVAVEDEITRLGLRHRLVTAHTSFVAVDRVRSTGGDPRQVVVPVEVPYGVTGGGSVSYFSDVQQMKKLESESKRLVQLERRQMAAERARLLELESRAHAARWQEELRVCLEPERLTVPVPGPLLVRIDVDDKGRVHSISVSLKEAAEDEKKKAKVDASIERCMGGIIKTWSLAGHRSSVVELSVEAPSGEN